MQTFDFIEEQERAAGIFSPEASPPFLPPITSLQELCLQAICALANNRIRVNCLALLRRLRNALHGERRRSMKELLESRRRILRNIGYL